MLNELIYRCMGNLKYFSLLMAAGMFAACSDNLENAGNGNEGDTLTGEKGYVNIGINLPTTNGSSRAPYSDSFDDGEESEYKVNDVIIALFYGGDDEASATCKHAFQISGAQFIESSPVNDNITTYSVSGVRMISDPNPGQKVYALALINAPSGIFQVTAPTNKSDEDAGNSVLTSKLQFRSSTSNSFADVTTLSGITAVAAEYITPIVGGAGGTGTKYYFMSNAPLSVSGAAQTLAPITVYKDKSSAEAGAASNPIYVERAAAKVTVSVSSTDGIDDNTLTVGNKYPHYEGSTVKFENWTLQNTNKEFYPVRNVDDFSKWMGYTTIKSLFVSTATDPCRIYWAEDPNYAYTTEQQYTDKLTVIKPETTGVTWNYIKSSAYCAENTTNATSMRDDRLTGILLKATFTPKAKVNAGAGTDFDFFLLNNTSAIYNKDEFLAVATNAITGTLDGGSLALKSGLTSGSTITTYEGVQSLLQVSGRTSSSLTQAEANAILDAAGGNIKYYKNGVTYYYATVIKHFGEDTPAPDDGVNYEEGKHLGRYGVVRNTWYELNITSVSGPGEPNVPEVPTTPPDKEESYINCEINVLSWAKRSQSVDL